MALFYIFVYFFNVCPERNWPNSHICFWIRSVVIMRFYWSIWRKSSKSYVLKSNLKSLFWSLKILLWYYTQIQQVIVSKRVVVMWNLRPYHWTFHASLYENPFIYLVLWVHLICVYDFVTSCIGHLENIGSLNNV